jgi:glutamine synthetase
MISKCLLLEYVWIGGDNELRSKTKVMDNFTGINHPKLKDFPEWNYDGSSTSQASGNDSEVILKPCAFFHDPFRGTSNSWLVLCDTYTPNNEPLNTNNRAYADKLFKSEKFKETLPWYGLEQEYFIMDPKTKYPIGFPTFEELCDSENPPQQGQYYCSVGGNNAFGRDIVETHLQACISAGIIISGVNAEVAPGQWEFQVGPCLGIESGDHLWMARYILQRVAETAGYYITFEPKPVEGNWNGSGCHANFSTVQMRETRDGYSDRSGLDYINDAITKLSKKHIEHMKVYGNDNELRMTGGHETASYDTFTDSVASRGSSIRRGNATVANKKGYFEDRRPSANCDPYLVTGKLFQTIVLED